MISNLFALRKRCLKKLKLQNGVENMSLYEAQFRQTQYQNPFFFAIQILDTLYPLLSLPLRAGNAKQNTVGIKVYWSKNRNQD